MRATRPTLFVPIAALAAALALATACGDSQTGDSEPPAPVPTGTSPAAIGLIDDARIGAAESEPGNWLAYGRTYEEQRFSPLDQVNRETVGRLGLAWMKDVASNKAQEATPIVVDGMMFFTTDYSIVWAVDAATGETRWRYDPAVPREWTRKTCCGPVNRGVAVYGGRVYVGTLDGYLVALDAATGEVAWRTDTLVDRDRPYTITGAPRAAKGKVFIGNGGAEFGVRGYVTAYDAESGEQVWRFYTVPGDPFPAVRASRRWSWPPRPGKAATGGKIGGGGTVWNSHRLRSGFQQRLPRASGNGCALDPGDPFSPGGGDNLFLSSIVALDADTGAYEVVLPDHTGRQLGLHRRAGYGACRHGSGRRDEESCCCRRRRTASST